MPRVLFTGGGGPGSEALWHLLGGRYEMHFADADRRRMDPSIPAARCHAVPLASDAAFVGELTALCSRERIDLLVPSVDEELLALAQARKELAPTRLLLPAYEYVATMLDKWKMAAVLSGLGIQVPATRLVSDGLEGVAFPCIAKPRRGRGSRGVSVLPDRQSAEALATQLGAAADSMLLQEKVEGLEYTVQMLADADGSLRALVPVKVLLKRGVTIHGETDPQPDVMAACSQIHRALPAAGCYNIQLMLSPRGQALPFEINPRVSTTLCLAVAAGKDPVSIFLGSDKRSDPLSCAAGIQLRRHWKNHFLKAEGT